MLLTMKANEILKLLRVVNAKLDSEEIFEEIVSMLHCYSMKLYLKRRNHSIVVDYES